MMATAKYHTVEVLPRDLVRGNRCVASYGIVTFDRATDAPDGRVTLHWQEDQPAVTRSRFNAVEVVQEPLYCEFCPEIGSGVGPCAVCGRGT